MKKTITLFAAIMLANCTLQAQTYFGKVLTHTANAANISGHITKLDAAETGAVSGKKFIFSHVYGAYVVSSQGIYFDGTGYSIYNQNTSTNMVATDRYKILQPTTGGTIFTHTVSAANSSGNVSTISNSMLDGKSNAMIFFSKTWDNAVYDLNHIGVWYDGANWTIYNEDASTPLEIGLTVDIFVPDAAATSFLHATSASNISGHITTIDHPLLNGNPDANVFVSHVYDITGGYLNAATSVWYDAVKGKWTIYADDLTPMPVGAKFAVLVAGTTPSRIQDVASTFIPSLVSSVQNKTIKLSMQGDCKFNKVLVYNINGTLVRTQVANETSTVTLDAHSLLSGVYFVEAETNFGKVSAKIVLQ
jgi:hypothetical protein